MKVFLRNIVLIFVVLAILGFTNKVDENALEETWSTVIHLRQNFSFIYDNDSYDNINLIQEPEKIIGSYRQSRPFMLYIASAVYHSILAAFDIGHNVLNIEEDKQIHKVNSFQIALFVCIGLNVLILAGALLLLERIYENYTQLPYKSIVIGCLMTLLLSDDLVRVCIFSANFQMFQFLMPILSVYWIRANLTKQSNSIIYSLFSGSIVGALFLSYASFAVMASSWALMLFYREWIFSRVKERKYQFGNVLEMLFLFSIAFICMAFLWGTYLNFKGATSLNMVEVERFRQFIWWFDFLREGGVLVMIQEMTSRGLLFIKNCFSGSVVSLIVTAIFLVLGLIGGKLSKWNHSIVQIFTAIAIVLVPLLIFWYLEGLYIWRYLKTFFCLSVIVLGCIVFNLCEKSVVIRNSSLAVLIAGAVFQLTRQLFYNPRLHQGGEY